MDHKGIHAVFHAQNVGYVAPKALCAQNLIFPTEFMKIHDVMYIVYLV